MFTLILGALVVFTVLILIAANQITGSVEEERGEDPRMRAAVVDRIKPVAQVNVAGAPAPAAAEPVAAAKSGADVAAAACNACHLAGVLGAPKIGDSAAWSQRLSAEGGIDGLTASAIKGKGQMPPKGGAMVSDAEIHAAIEHMLSESGVDAAAAGAAPAAAGGGAVEAMQQMAGDAMDAAKSMAAAVMPAAAPEAAAPAAVDLAKGKQVYDSACFACHLTGAAGAPKLGDKAAWAPRLGQGTDALLASVLNGKGAMPPKGGRMDIADGDIASAVAYMVDAAK
jgi:cytochrome c5